jgi:hypothetical protein
MMVAMGNLRVEYGHCPGQQTYENVLNNTVQVTNGLWVSLPIRYIAIRIMENIGSCFGGNINSYPRLNSCINVP